MKFSDFDTLELAHAYFIRSKVNKNDLANHDATHDVETILNVTIARDDLHPEFRKVVRVFLKVINGLLDNTPLDDDVTQTALTALVASDKCNYTQNMRNHLESLSLNYPYADKTKADWDARDIEEILNLNSNLNMHSVSLNISTKPDTPARISIQHRFGTSGNLTEWHEVGSIGSVLYTQQTFQSANIPACTAQIREMRAVCDKTIGMSIA
jgi:hypothetical protein